MRYIPENIASCVFKMASRARVLQLYRELLREGQKFTSYNYRRIRDAFKENKDVAEPQEIQRQLLKAEKNLGILKRQVVLSQLYGHGKLVIEK